MLRARRSWLPFAATALAVLVGLPSLASPVDAATSKWSAKCEVRIRTAPKTGSSTLRIVQEGAVVTSTGTVSGGSYGPVDCPSDVSGSSWLKIVAINGKSTSSLFGRSAVYAASKLFKSVSTTTSTTNTTTASYLSNCSVRLRAASSTKASTKSIIGADVVVTTSGQVTGGSWKADCKTTVSGNTWFKITAVGGKSVSSLYGVSVVYAASGLFRKVSTSGFKEGIDVSHWQGVIDWAKVRASGKTFVFAKATEGIGFKDDRYERNKAGAMGQGLKFGAYHFAQPVNDPVREADWFVNNMGLERGMLLPVLDLERTGGRGPTGLTNWVKTWLERVRARTGAKAIIYASPSFWRTNLNDTRWFADNNYAMLWVAHWGVSSPSVMADNWGGKSWTFWQYTSSGSVPGISGRVDLNRYRFDSFGAVTY